MSIMTSFVLAAMIVTPALVLGMEVSMTSSLTFDAEAAKKRPVTKVVNLLKDMQAQMEKEGEEDEDSYNKMACWCLTNGKEKTKSIADAKSRISDLTSTIEGLTATSARLSTEIDNLNTEVAANQAALDKATAIRQKQLKEFNSEEKDVLGSVSALKSAVVVMKKHNSFLQMPNSHIDDVAKSMQHVMQKHSSLLTGVLTHSEKRAVTAFIQTSAHAPASGEIFGILTTMKETFETNLANSQKEEETNQKAFEDLKAAKQNEIEAGQTQVDTKSQELADGNEKNAQSKQDVEDTSTSLAADEEFLASLKDKCKLNDSEWEQRQKARQLEQEACSKALAVLSSDDAHDLFSKSLGFVQVESHSASRTKAAKLLSAAAEKHGNPRLSMLVVQVRLDAFTKVKKAMDDMIAALTKEGQDEIKQNDFCVDEFRKNKMQSEKKARGKTDDSAKVADLSQTIKTLGDAMTELNTEIGEMQTQLKRAGEDRKTQSKENQMTVADQRATQKLLASALNILKGVYAKKAALVQSEEMSGAPYKKNAAAGGVMGMIQQIITDAKATEAEAIRSEADAQKAYEDTVKQTNKSIAAKRADNTNKSENKAKADANLVEAKKNKANVVVELEQLGNAKSALKSSCDFLVKNFSVRQSARGEEIEAIQQAKAILSGAKFAAFLQNA